MPLLILIIGLFTINDIANTEAKASTKRITTEPSAIELILEETCSSTLSIESITSSTPSSFLSEGWHPDE